MNGGASEVVGYCAVVIAATVAGVGFVAAADTWRDEVSRYSPCSAVPKPSSPLQPPQEFAPHLVEDC